MIFIKNDAASFLIPVTGYLYAFLMNCASSSSSSEIQCSTDNKEKKCPGFGDTLDLIACCPSKVETGDYYCCTLDEKRRSEYSWKDDFAENFAEIIGGVVAALLVTFTLVVVCCFFCSCCYLHRHRRRRQRDSSSSESCRRSACPCPNMNSSDDSYCGSRSNSQVRGYRDSGRTLEPLITSQPPYHRHQSGLSHFQPKPYDAPPPYPIAQQCPAFNPRPFVHNSNNMQREVEFHNSNSNNNNNLHNIINNYNNQRAMNNAQPYADAWDDDETAKTC